MIPFARLEHRARQLAATLARTLTEWLSGFDESAADGFALDRPCPDCKLATYWSYTEGAWIHDDSGHIGCVATDLAAHEAGPHVRYFDAAWNEIKTPAAGQRGESPAAGTPEPVAGSSVPAGNEQSEAARPAGSPVWAILAICDVLAEHTPIWRRFDTVYECTDTTTNATSVCSRRADERDWREHVAPLIAARVELAARSAGEGDYRCIAIAQETFPQHRKSSQ